MGNVLELFFIVGGDRVDAALIVDENVSGTSAMLKFKHVNISGTGSRILSSFRVPHSPSAMIITI